MVRKYRVKAGSLGWLVQMINTRVHYQTVTGKKMHHLARDNHGPSILNVKCLYVENAQEISFAFAKAAKIPKSNIILQWTNGHSFYS